MKEQFNEKDSLQKDIESQTTAEGIKSFIDDTEAWGGHEDIVLFAKKKLEDISLKANAAEQTSESHIVQINEMEGSVVAVAERTKNIDKQIEEVKANAAAEIGKVEAIGAEIGEKSPEIIIDKRLQEYTEGNIIKFAEEGRPYKVTKTAEDKGSYYLAEIEAILEPGEDSKHKDHNFVELEKTENGSIGKILARPDYLYKPRETQKVEGEKNAGEVIENNINNNVAEPEKVAEVQNETTAESVVAPETKVESPVVSKPEAGPEKVISKGEERYNKISDTITTQKNKFTGWISRGTEGLGKFIKKGLIGALEAPEDITHGVKVVGNKIVEESGYIKDSIVAGATIVGKTTVEGFKSMGNDYNKFDKYRGEKVEQIGEWVGFSAAQAYESSSNWIKEKKTKTENIINGVSLATETVYELAKDKSIEKLENTRDSIKKSLKELKKHGESALDTARLWAWYKKDDYNKKKNAIKEAYLKKKGEIEYSKMQKILEKNAQLNQIGKKGEKLEYKIAA